jgi:hypothetical protein
MKARYTVFIMGLLVLWSGILSASPRSQRALWIQITDEEGHRTTIALTEAIAREIFEADGKKVHFAKEGKKELITREMLKSVLDGKEESVEAKDEDGSEAKLSMADLNVPDHKNGKGKLVLETYKSGSRTFRIAIPELEIDASDEAEGGGDTIEMSLGWKALLPFLAKEGGAIYINSDKDETEVWLYVE